jgi:hypothetical protein
MLMHCVFCALKPEVPEAEIRAVCDRFASLVGAVEGMTGFQHGPNRDFEDKTGAFGWGFVCVFLDRTAHLAYERHPVHQAAGADLVALCQGGHAGIRVYDLDCAEIAVLSAGPNQGSVAR